MEMNLKVRQIRDEAVDIKSFELASGEGQILPSYQSGSHIDVHVGGVIRQYSLCDAPGVRDFYTVAVKRELESRGGSRAMHEQIQVGDEIVVSHPRNNFPLDDAAQHTLLLAGGIGITPILGMARHLKAKRAPFHLQYFSRSIEHTAFHADLSRKDWANEVSFHYALDPVALKAYLRKTLWHRIEGSHLYLCGPRPFMELVQDVAAATWAPEFVHVEYFSADPQALAGPQTEFEVRLERSAKTCRVREGVSIAQAIQEIGVAIPTSCEQGVCGTCLTGVLAGIPDHRDAYLTSEERACNDKMLPCVSRSLTASITLDL